MKGVLVSCAQMTWQGAPEEQMLRETAAAGYDGSFAVYRGGTRSPEEILETYARHGLKPSPGYLSAQYWDKEQLPTILEQAAYLAGLMRALGLTEIFVGSGRTPERDAIAARVQPENRFGEEGVRQVAAALNRVGEVTLKDGVRACLHSHVGSYFETREEIDRLVALVDPALVFHGPDTGHLAWAGADPVEYFRDYADRIKVVHLKDIDPAVREEGIRAGWDYQTFSDRGIFAEVGEGMVDFPAVLAELATADYKGWLIVETDVTTKPTAAESARISRENLKKLGV